MSNTATYLQELARQAGLSEEEQASLSKVLANTKFVEEVGKGVARQSDYSRSMDEVKTLKQSVETQISSWREWYTAASTRDAEREAELQALRTKVNGNPNPNPNPNPDDPTTKGLTLKEIQEREGRMISIVKQGMRLASRHAAKFGEELDVDALEKIAVEKGLTLDRAYDEFVAPRVKVATDKAVEDRIAAARAEGLQEGLSKRDIPSEGDRGYHPVFRTGAKDAAADPSKLTDGQRAANFADAWNKEVAAKR